MFASVALAGRIDAAEVDLTLQAGRLFAARNPDVARIATIAGGAAVLAPGSPFDKVIGLGFEPFDGAAQASFAGFEEDALARGGAVQVELSSLGDPAVAQALARRGYGLAGFENVLGLELDGVARSGPAAPGIVVSPAGRTEQATWVSVVATAFESPDVGDGPPSHETFSRQAVEEAMGDMAQVVGFSCFLARREGHLAGGASMCLDARRGVAQLTGAATLPGERRRGVQSALLAARLQAAASAGARIAVVTTRPGSKSQENAMKNGFSLLYVRAVLRKPAT